MLLDFKKYNACDIIDTYGFTKEPISEDYILVIKYAAGGDLQKYLQENFVNITWNKKLKQPLKEKK
ncbi:hypothetical protein RhiirB3_446391 [Rhizophagus irregularis]|nr:hypothetical protein RhiirB3_446391 [Rhizophagus irregularis]